MPDTTSKTAGTEQRAYACWELAHAEGAVVEHGDGVPHFRSHEESLTAAPEYATTPPWRTIGDAPSPRQLDAPCFIAVAICGYQLDQDNTGPMCHATADEAYRAAVDSDFKDLGDGTLRCSEDCDECVDAVSARQVSETPA